MAALLGTLKTLGSSLIGNLLSQGAETLGNIATNKLKSFDPGEQVGADSFKKLTGRIEALEGKVQNYDNIFENANQKIN